MSATPARRFQPSEVPTLHVAGDTGIHDAGEVFMDRMYGRIWVGVCPSRTAADLPPTVGGLACTECCYLPDTNDTQAMLASYAAGGCPPEVLADWIENQRPDGRADDVADALRGRPDADAE